MKFYESFLLLLLLPDAASTRRPGRLLPGRFFCVPMVPFFLDRLSERYKSLRSAPKRDTIKSLQKYVAAHVEMTDHPVFRAMRFRADRILLRLPDRPPQRPWMRWDGDSNGDYNYLLCRPVGQVLAKRKEDRIVPLNKLTHLFNRNSYKCLKNMKLFL